MESVLRADPKFTISSVQLLNRVWLFVTPWTAAQLLPCPSPTPRACSNSCPSSRWCHSLYPSDIYTIQDSISLFLSPNTIDHREYYQKRSSTTKNIKRGPDEMSKSSRGHDLHIRWMTHKQEDIHNCRSSAQGVRGLSPTAGFPACGSCVGKTSPQDAWLWGARGL